MKKIRDDAGLTAWQQGPVQLLENASGVHLVTTVDGLPPVNLRVNGNGIELMAGTPRDLMLALLALTGEDPDSLIKRHPAPRARAW